MLHRDVSAFNIMIYRYKDPKVGQWKRKGILVDWGLCKYARELTQRIVQKNRSVRIVGWVVWICPYLRDTGHLAVHICCSAAIPGQVPA